jgi:hypothetical protein
MDELEINKRVIQKIGGVACILGALLITCGSLIVPKSNDMSNILEMQRVYGAHSQVLQLSAIFLMFGFWGLFIGVLGIRYIMTGVGTVWAHIGLYFNLIGTTIWTIGMSLDISYPAAIVNWLSAGETDKQTAYSVVSVLSPLGFGRGLFPVEVMIIWLSYIFISLGIILSKSMPRLLGWIGLIIGVMGVILGVVMVFIGRESALSFYIVLMLCVLIWFLVIGVYIIFNVRKSKTIA